MKRMIALLIILLILSPAALAGGGSNEDNIQYAVVYNPNPADRLNLRTKPDTGSISLGKFYNGTPVAVKRVEGEWAYVTLFDGFSGYMHTDFLACGASADQVVSAMPVVTVTAPTGKRVVSSMLGGASVLASLSIGMRLEVMGVMEDWLFVRAGDIVGFTENSGTTPRIYFSSPDATPPARVPLLATPTPSPTPLPAAADGQVYARVAARTWLYEDEALTKTLAVLQEGKTLRIERTANAVCQTTIDGRAGYVDASYLAFSSDFGPGFSVDPVEGARNVTDDDWIIFASMKKPVTFYADKAMTHPIGTLQKGELVRIFNDISVYATLVMEDRIAGYFPAAQNFIVHSAYWPFHIDQPCAAVENPILSDRLHLREAPDKEARSLGRYYNGAIVTLLDNVNGRNEWTHVDICGVHGYMMSEFLTFSPDLDKVFSCLSLYEIGNPNTGDLHLRERPDTSSKSLGLYENGTLVAVIGVTGDWVHVICDGKTGFMLHRHLRTAIGTSFDPYQ